MTVSISASIVVLSAIVGMTAPVPRKSNAELYYPVTKGAVWQYEDKCGECDISIVTSIDTLMNDKLISVSRKVDDQLTPHQVVRVAPNGLYDVKIQDGKIVASLCLLKLPVKTGSTWEVTLDHVGLPKIKGKAMIDCIEDIKVPAGTYRAVRVIWKYELNGIPTERSYWYAPRVGLIKIQSANNTWVLKSFTHE